jgi:hypothetical protein
MLAGCAASGTAGLIAHPPADDLGASFDGRLGIGGVVDTTVVLDLDTRVDVAHDNSRFALGTGVTGGYPLFGRTRVLARAGIWGSLLSTPVDRSIVPTFELAAYIPSDESPHTADSIGSKFGWHSTGLTVGVREDLDTVPYTTLFIGGAFYLIPGY